MAQDPRLPHGLRRQRSGNSSSSLPNHWFLIEGPWNVGNPVHELITERALQQASIIAGQDQFKSPAAWEFVRGVIWNDDPEAMLFDNNERETDNWASGLTFARAFRAHETAVKGDKRSFGPGSPLLARSHFGDLQCLHAMAARDREDPQITRKSILEWASFLYWVAIGKISGESAVNSATVAQMHEWFPNSSLRVRDLFHVGQRGNLQHRAAGALMHLVQDSYASGHVERRDYKEIVEFHCYTNQDADKHKEGDKLDPGGIDAMPGAMRAVDACGRILSFWKRGMPWHALLDELERGKVFTLADDARPASAGHGFGQSHRFKTGASTGSKIRTCRYVATGTIFDDDIWPDQDEQGSYTWTDEVALEIGGVPAVRRHSAVVDDEVELRAVLFFSMDTAEKVYVQGELTLLEGYSGGRDLVSELTFGPLAVARNASSDLLDTKLETGEGGWGSFKLGLTNMKPDW